MIKSIDIPESTFYDVIDLETGKKIPFIHYADDEKNEYSIYLKNEEGRFLLNENGTGVKLGHKKGKIKIIKRDMIE